MSSDFCMKFLYLSCALFVLVIAGAVECVEPIVEGSTEPSSDSSQQEPELRLTNGSVNMFLLY